jgi:hypothetical protein
MKEGLNRTQGGTMSGRYFVYSFAVLAVIGLGFLLYAPQGRPQAGSNSKWEYSVLDLDQEHCSTENLSASLSAAGQLGWELVNYERQPGESSILIAPAATSFGKTTVPPTADSFSGTVTPAGSGGCRLVFKRPG